MNTGKSLKNEHLVTFCFKITKELSHSSLWSVVFIDKLLQINVVLNKSTQEMLDC